jgi:hypothetical protein
VAGQQEAVWSRSSGGSRSGPSVLQLWGGRDRVQRPVRRRLVAKPHLSIPAVPALMSAARR